MSSPYLITEIILAHRRAEVDRAELILNHPGFGKNVTTMIFDASKLNARHGHDADGINTWECSALDDTLEKYYQLLESAADWQSSLRQAMQADAGHAADSERVSSTEIGVTETRALPVVSAAQDVPFADLESDSAQVAFVRESRDAYTIRCLDEYQIENSMTLHKLMRRAFTTLPRLTKLIYTDYCGLGRIGESFDQLCSRLFDVTWQPPRLSEVDYMSDSAWTQLNSMLQIIADSGGRLLHLSVGDNPFREGDDSHVETYYPSAMLGACVSTVCAGSAYWNTLGTTLQKLELSLAFFDKPADDTWDLRRASFHLAAVFETVVDLSLDAGFADPWTFNTATNQDYQPNGLLNLGYFCKVLAHLKHSRLRRLVLRGWPLMEQAVVQIVRRSAITLRTLHLINCSFLHDPCTAHTIFLDPAPFSGMTGIEISHLRLVPLLQSYASYIVEGRWRLWPIPIDAQRVNDYHAASGRGHLEVAEVCDSGGVWFGAAQDRRWEDMIMDGRRDSIVRMMGAITEDVAENGGSLDGSAEADEPDGALEWGHRPHYW